MKNWKSVIALITAVGICGSLAACGGYDYYDELEKEYEKYGITSCTYLNKSYIIPNMFGYRDYSVLYDDSIILSLNDNDQQKLFVYNTTKKELTATIDYTVTNTTAEGPLFCNGYIYNITTEFSDDYEQERFLNKIDLNGNITLSRSITKKDENGLDSIYLSLIYVTQSGKVIMEDKTGARLLLDSDFEEARALTAPDNSFFVEPVADYEDHVLCKLGNGEFYWLDINSMDWQQADTEYINVQSMSEVKCVGKYLLGTNFVYDMDSLEAVTEKMSTNNFAGSYVGGDFSISADLDNYVWYSIQFPDDGSDPEEDDLKKIGDLEEEHYNFNIVPIDSEHYVISDDFGAYMTTYKDGKDDIETIIEF